MKRTVMIAGAVVVLVALPAGAAFVGGQLLTGQGLAGQASPLGHNSTQNIPAKQLPQTPPDADGVFDHRKDNSVFVGTGQVRKAPQTDQSGNVSLSLTHEGPIVEVVVTAQTLIYRDVTMEQFNGQRPSDTTTVQQVVEPGRLDEIGENCPMSAWGRKTGDRIIAEVLVYAPPPPVMNGRP